MSVRCPYCHFLLELKGAHAGRFTPKCPQCQHRFMLVIAEDANIPPLVGEMPAASQGSVAGATQTQRTVTQAPAPAPAQTRAAAQQTSATIPPPSPAAPPPLSP